MIEKDLIKNIFYKFVNDAKRGITYNIDQYAYLRFDYYENGKRDYKELNDEEYLGDDNKTNFDYGDDSYNGSANYIPTLIVNDTDKFFDSLSKCVNEYYKEYKFDRVTRIYGLTDSVVSILSAIFSNARYQDYKNPIEYLDRYLDFFQDKTLIKYDNTIISEKINILDDSYIKVSNEKDSFGYETPYKFNISFISCGYNYNLPTINYGISDNVCYIYSIQNKEKNEENDFTKKIKRKLNKVGSGVVDDTDYEDNKDTILGTTPSFITAMTIFMKILKENNIDKIRFITLLPDRYLEKTATRKDYDTIQNNLTQKNILLFYRLKYHFDNIDINFPMYDGYSIIDDKNIGDDLIVTVPEITESNNDFLNQIISSFKESDKIAHKSF